MAQPHFIIAGGGVIGLSVALELERRGAGALVLESGVAMRQTSAAAAGMLAAEDRANPPELSALAHHSLSLYTSYLARVSELSGRPVEFQTYTTLQQCAADAPDALTHPQEEIPELASSASPLRRLQERSIDPRELGQALRAAVQRTQIDLREHTSVLRVASSATSIRVETSNGTFEAEALIDCMGSWSPAPVAPRKGQMLAVASPAGFALRSTVRTEDVYIVPRTYGANAGRLIIGATIEDAGFDLTVHPKDILSLNARAVRLLPALARAGFVESWAGLRPATVDGLPILGATPAQPRYLLATGHFRNGILLAPGTAELIAQLALGESPSVDLAPFSPARFSRV